MMQPVAQLVLLLLAGQCVHGSLQQQQQQQQQPAIDTSRTSSPWDAPAYSLRKLLPENAGPAALAAADAQLMAAASSSSSSTVLAAAAGPTCRITAGNATGLTLRCHSSCHVCSRGSNNTAAERRQCRCCKPGFFLAAGVNSASCTACPVGQFNALFGQTACRRCPRNMVTLTAGSRVCNGTQILWLAVGRRSEADICMFRL
jgi:hypothetical protein